MCLILTGKESSEDIRGRRPDAIGFPDKIAVGFPPHKIAVGFPPHKIAFPFPCPFPFPFAPQQPYPRMLMLTLTCLEGATDGEKCLLDHLRVHIHR